MAAIALMYHDVIDGGDADASGLPGPAAGSYKLSRAMFEAHLDAIAEAAGAASVGLAGRLGDRANSPAVLLTFDDGGVSAASVVAPLLANRGWKAYFFVTTDRVGHPGFLTGDQIVELRAEGHLIGTHSCSHPPRIDRLTWVALTDEWRRSREALSELLHEEVRVGSVPGGHYSRAVGEAAVASGIETLFTSEPTCKVSRVSGCTVVGRYHLRSTSSASTAGALARGDKSRRWAQSAAWAGKRVARALAGPLYSAVRDRVFSERSDRAGR